MIRARRLKPPSVTAMLASLVVVFSGAAAANAADQTSPRTFQGKDGLIAYQGLRGGAWNIFVANQARATRRVTSKPGNEVQPAFSPNGRKIAFVRKNDERDSEILIVDAGGGDPQRLTANRVEDRQPVFSPDGRRIAFSSNRSGNFDIWTMRTDGTEQKRISAQPGPAANPAFSPDGSRILFEGVNYNDSPFGRDAILSVASDSPQPQAATTKFVSFVPIVQDPAGFSLSATGNKVAFSIRTRTGITQSWGPYQLRIGGSVGACGCEYGGSFPNLNLTLRKDGDATRPDFSPEGDWVAYERDGEIWQMSTDYTRERAPEYRRMTSSEGRNANPDWGPAKAP